MQNDMTSETCTSIVENVGSCHNPATESAVEIVDVPGNIKVRGMFRRYLDVSRWIVFLVSAADVKRTFKDDAAYLHEIIVANVERRPILVFCNKSDVDFSESKDVVQLLLEKELNKRRVRVASPGETLKEGEDVLYGDPVEDFHFDQLPMHVVFGQGSVKNNDIENVWTFLNLTDMK